MKSAEGLGGVRFSIVGICNVSVFVLFVCVKDREAVCLSTEKWTGDGRGAAKEVLLNVFPPSFPFSVYLFLAN